MFNIADWMPEDKLTHTLSKNPRACQYMYLLLINILIYTVCLCLSVLHIIEKRNNHTVQKYIDKLTELEINIDRQQQQIESTNKHLEESALIIASLDKMSDKQLTELETNIDVQQKELKSINKQIDDNASTISSLRCDLLDVQLKLRMKCGDCSKFEDWINKLVRDIESEASVK